MNLVLVGRDAKRLEAVQKEVRAVGEVLCEIALCDVRDKIAVQERLSPFKNSADLLINNAGLALGADDFEAALVDDFDVIIDTNVKGLLYVTKLFAPHLKGLASAHVVNLGSVAGRTAYPGGNVYCATKAAVKMLSEALNVDFFGTNVKVSCIAPGAAQTNFSTVRYKDDAARAGDVYRGFEPLSAHDVADLICYILNTPPHVNIQYADIMSTAQRNPYLVDRKP